MFSSQQSRLRRFRLHFLQSYNRIIVVLSIIVGLLVGLCAVGFRKFITFVESQAWQVPAFNLATARDHASWQVIMIPALGGLAVGLIVYFFAREAKGHGVPEVMEAIVLRGGRIRARVVVGKLVASGICIGTGGSAGREGPVVQIGAALGSAVGQLMNLGEKRLKTLVGCGAAAGIAATFNAPIAGVLFATEVILGDFTPALLTPIVVSSVSATAVSRYFFADKPAFMVPEYALVSPWELVIYAALGLIAGLVALLFIKVLYAAEDLFDGPLAVIPGPLRTTLGGAIIGVTALYLPEIMGVGYEAIELALSSGMLWHTLILICIVKILAVSVTIGSGGSGGVFAPSLMIGAMTGGALGTAVHSLWPYATASSGAYALVGAGAVVAAATHAPLTALMIIFELTNDYKIILPLMIACVIATMFASHLSKASIYTKKLLRRGLDVFKGSTPNVLSHMQVRDVMRKPEGMVPASTHLLELISQFMANRDNSIFVVDDEEHLLGVVAFDDLRPIIAISESLNQAVIARDIMHVDDYPTIGPEESLDAVMRQLGQYRYEVPVLEEGKLVGSILAEDVIACYNTEVFKREMATGMASSMQDAGQFATMPGAMGVNLAELPVPSMFIGQSLRDLNLRNTWGISVLLVKSKEDGTDATSARAPDASHVFSAGDSILAMGSMEAVDKLRGMM